MDKYKVIFHIDELARAGLVLNNISNLLIDMGEDNLEIEMVANGDAVKMLVKSSNEYKLKLEELANKHVVFCACANSLRGFSLPTEELLSFVEVVSAGVGEIVKKQAAGWSYIRP